MGWNNQQATLGMPSSYAASVIRHTAGWCLPSPLDDIHDKYQFSCNRIIALPLKYALTYINNTKNPPQWPCLYRMKGAIGDDGRLHRQSAIIQNHVVYSWSLLYISLGEINLNARSFHLLFELKGSICPVNSSTAANLSEASFASAFCQASTKLGKE